jgi:leucyl aminopeptidase
MLVGSPSVQAQATTQNPFETDADTIAIGVFEDEGVAHDLPGEELMALLDSGEAQRKLKRLAVTHSQGRRVILAGLGDRTKFDGERARVAAGVV